MRYYILVFLRFAFVFLFLVAITFLHVHRGSSQAPHHRTEMFDPDGRCKSAHLSVRWLRLAEHVDADTERRRHMHIPLHNTRDPLDQIGPFGNLSFVALVPSLVNSGPVC